MQPKIWGITDTRDGHKSQMEGVLKALALNSKVFSVKNSILGKLAIACLPLGISWRNFLYFKRNLKQYSHSLQAIVVIGRRNLSLGLYLKKQLLLKNPKIKLIFLMPPGIKSHKLIDLIFIHKYKLHPKKNHSKNSSKNKTKLIGLHFSPSKFNYQTQNFSEAPTSKPSLAKASVATLAKLSPPLIGVLLGGSAKGVVWNENSVKQLCKCIQNIHKKNGGTVVLISSRRTTLTRLISSILGHTNIVYLGFENSKDGNLNSISYHELLLLADALIITGESSSMIADGCSLTKNIPIIIFDHPTFMAKNHRYKQLHSFLYTNNYAISLDCGNIALKSLASQTKVSNSAYYVARNIKNNISL